MRSHLLVTSAAVAVLAVVAPISSATVGRARPVVDLSMDSPDPTDPGCEQIPPDDLPAVPADTSDRLPIELRVLVDPADHELAIGYIADTVAAYDRINVAMKVSWDVVPIPTPRSTDPRVDMFAFMRARYHGKRPKGVDVVYLMTRFWAGGFADCIGGVRDDVHSFALGSVDYATEGVVPAPFTNEGYIAAHEIGHLLGAHHHYSSCAEAHPSAGLRGEPGPCTVMTPLAHTMTGTFSTLETAFIRDYVRKYARG